MFGLERGKGGSIVVWLILGVLALAFGLTFGLPSDQLSFGENGYVKVHGENISNEDLVYQRQAIARVFALPEGAEAQALGVREEVLEAVVERLVLVNIGEQLGLMTEKRDAELLTKDGFRIVLDEDQPFPWAGTEDFDYAEFKLFLAQSGVSETRYLEIQRQELLARQVRDLLAAGVTIPEPELWAAYEKDNNQMSLSYVQFMASDHAELVDPSPAEVDAWIEEHEAELQQTWEINQPRYLKLPPQVDLRLIEIGKPVAPPASLLAGAEDGGVALRAEHEAKLAAARAAAAAARARIVAGGESFASVARELSRDAETARSGGRFGWTLVTETGSGLDPVIDSAAQDLPEGELSELLEGEDAFYLITVAGRREGDVPEELGKRELAADALRFARGRELAKRAAEEALLAIEQGATLEQLFGKPALGEGGAKIEDYALDGDGAPAPARPSGTRLEETGLFSYGGVVPGIGVNPQISNAAWQADPDAPIIPEVFDVPGGFALVAVDERLVAEQAGFAEAREQLYRRLVYQRANATLIAFAKAECYRGKARVDIRVNDKVVNRWMSYDGELQVDEQGVRMTPPYQVCARVGDRGGALRAMLKTRGGVR